MSKNKKKSIFGKEIIYNRLGQILFKKRFIIRLTTNFYRYILKGS